MRNFSNIARQAFAEVVSIEAWHEKFTEERAVVDLHANVVFGEAPVGGEEASPVRFRLSLRRAELVVVIPKTEPLSVDPNSVSRDSPSSEARTTKTTEKTRATSVEGKLTGSASAAAGNLSIQSEIAGEASVKTHEKTEVNQTTGPISVKQSRTPEGFYRWELTAQTEFRLEGRGWDPIKEPRLKLIDGRKRPLKKSVSPIVRLDVKCRREDLIITDLHIKDEALHEKLIRRIFPRNKEAAAEAYIRNQLISEGLAVGNLGELFTQITLSRVTANA
jgi:hypothetical protein